MDVGYSCSGGASGLTLQQYAARIGYIVNSSPELRMAWVTAELSDVRHNGGHCYMELVEKDSRGQTVAKMRATIWSTTFSKLRRKFYQSTGSDIVSGIKVMVLGSASFHNMYGLSFNIVDIDPSYTMGDVERRRREILEQLRREGILDLNKQEELPLNPQRIAVISAGGAAGYGDFVRQLEENGSRYKFYPYLFEAVMQGDKTSATVRAALERIEETIDLWDCVVIIRGGGATTDLLGFDELELSRAVARCPLPVIVGIGHERDNTVLDYIAHTRCKTPTAVAAYLVDCLSRAEERAEQAVGSITRYALQQLEGENRRLTTYMTSLPAMARAMVQNSRARLEGVAGKLPLIGQGVVEREKIKLERLVREGLTDSRTRIVRVMSGLDNIQGMVERSVSGIIERENLKLQRMSELAGALDPRATLKRGYSITRYGGKALTNVGSIEPGAEIETTLYDGTLISTVKQLRK